MHVAFTLAPPCVVIGSQLLGGPRSVRERGTLRVRGLAALASFTKCPSPQPICVRSACPTLWHARRLRACTSGHSRHASRPHLTASDPVRVGDRIILGGRGIR
jgi:hypothetical protein